MRPPPDKLIVPQDSETFLVYPDQAGQRLDQFLKFRLKWRSRAKVQQLIAEREVTVAGLRVDRSYRVKDGDQVRLPLPPPPEAAFRIAEIPLEILFEDDQLVVLNKQPNIVVHPAGGHRYDTLINALHLRYRNLGDHTQDIVPKLAHRIDRETSGVLVVVKTGRHQRGSPLVFEKSDVRKEYLTIAEGVIEQDSGDINVPLARQFAEGLDRGMMIDRADGLICRTGFEVLERFEKFTFVRCRLYTGRMHQIRAHLKAIGHPVACDKNYGLRSELRLSEIRPLRPGEEDAVLLDRQALHAWRITFDHPTTRQPITIEAPLPADMQRTLEALRGMPPVCPLVPPSL